MRSPAARGLSLNISEENLDDQVLTEFTNLKAYQKFAIPESPWLVDKFPLTANPAMAEMQQLLSALNKLCSDEILPKDKNYVLFPELSQIMLHSLSLAHALAVSDVTDRKEKIGALTVLINKIIPLAAAPKFHRNPNIAKSAGEEFLVTMNMSWYVFSRKTLINNHVFKLDSALDELSRKVLPGRDYSNVPTIVTLTMQEQAVLEHKIQRYIHDKAQYEYACKVLQKEMTLADFEFINTRVNRNSFNELITQLQRMNGYTEDLKNRENFAHPQFQAMMQYGIDLTFEIIHSKKLVGRKFDALAETLHALTDYAMDFKNSRLRERLNSATANLRNLTEGSSFNRQEHRLRNGLIGSITLFKGLMMATTGILLIVALPPATIVNPVVGLLAAVSMILIGAASIKGFVWLSNSIFPPDPTQQDISLKISKQIDSINKFYQNNSVTSTFQPLSGATEEKNANSMLRLPHNSYNNELFLKYDHGVVALKKLKRFQLANAVDDQAFATLIDEFPLEISSATVNLINVLQNVGKISDTCLNNPTTPRYEQIKNLINITVKQSLMLTQQCSTITVAERLLKLQILADTMGELNNCFMHTIEAPAESLTLEATENLQADFYKKLLKESSLMNLTINTSLASDLHQSILSICADLPHPIISSYTTSRSIYLPVEENNKIDLRMSRFTDTYNYYNNFLQELSGYYIDERQFCSLGSCSSVIQYEIIKVTYMEEFLKLLERLAKLKKVSQDSPFFSPIQALLHNTVLLTEEIGHADYNIARSSQQKGKIIALSETIHQTLVFMENTSESAKENLIKAANKLRNNVEGGYFFRAENRIMTGILAALVSVAAIGIMLIPILLLTPVIPIISAALIVEIAGSFVVGIATLAASSKALLRSMYPLNPEQQTYSRGIYQEVNSLQPTLFKNKPREEEKRDASLQPSILHNPTLGVV